MNPLYSRLKIRHIRVVVAIADMGNPLRASQAMSITQPAMSKALAEVEDVVGDKLFDRTPFGTRPTAFGESLIRHGRSVLTQLDRVHGDFEGIRRGNTGTIRLGVFSLLADWPPITKSIHNIRQVMPDLPVFIDDGNMEDLIAKLDVGSLDVVFGRYPYAVQQSHHTLHGLHQDRIVLVANTNHALFRNQTPLTLKDLVEYTWILPPAKNIVRLQLEIELSKLGLSLLKTPITSLSVPINLRLVQASDFIMLMPQSVARAVEFERDIRVIPYEVPFSVGPLAAIWRSDREIDRLRDFMLDCLTSLLKIESESDSVNFTE
jgi:DNA-binding transcriptional LysR family regulator